MPKTPRVKSIRVRRRRPTCLGCFLRGLECHYGTLAGNCTECGQYKSTMSFSDPSPRFSQVPTSFSELIRQAQVNFPLQPDGSPNSMLRIHTTTVVDGSKRTHTLVVPGGGSDFENQMRDEMDLLVRKICFPDKEWAQPLTGLCQSAMDARGYLSLLLSSNITEGRTTTRDGENEDEVIHGNSFGLQIINFILPRLDDLIGVVIDALGKEQTNDDDNYWADVSAAAAILYKGLHGVHSGLISGKTRPFCDRVELTAHLPAQVKSVADSLITTLLDQGLGCNTAVVSHVNALFHGLQSSILVEDMTITQERHLINLDPTGYSPKNSSTTAFGPYQSSGIGKVPAAGIPDERHSFVVHRAPEFYSVPSTTQYSDPLPLSCPAPLAIQYRIPEPPTVTSASSQLHRQTMAEPSHSYPHGTYGFQLHPWMNPASQNFVQKIPYQPVTYKPVHHLHGPTLSIPISQTVPTFIDSLLDPTMIHRVNSGHTADHFGNDPFPQGDLQQDEYYSPHMSSYVSSTDMFYSPPETSIQIAPPCSAPFWSEQYVTWRQS